MLQYEVKIELDANECIVKVNEYIHPSIYLDIDELKWLDFNVSAEWAIDIEIPAESRQLNWA